MTRPYDLHAIGALLDQNGLLVGDADCAPYQIGARYDAGKAAFVARPTTINELSAVVSWCVRNGVPFVPQSGNTGLVSGSTPDATGTQGVISTERLKDTFDVDLDNRTLTVDGGFRLSEINDRLRPYGLFFPIDLGADPCVGGMVSTNTGGARFLRYGDVRRNTLGVDVVLADADATVLRLGKGLRKDNTGIDWKQLFIGTSGAFGVVARATFNLEWLPAQTATALLVPSSDESVITLLARLEREFGAELTAFEGMSGEAIRYAVDHVPSLRNPFAGVLPSFAILLEVSRASMPRTGEGSLENQMEEVLAAIWESNDAPLQDAIVGRPTEIWALRHALSEGVKAAGQLVAFDLGFHRADVMQFRRKMREVLEREFPGVVAADFGHIGDGGLHFNLVIDRDLANADPMRIEQIRDRIVGVAVQQFGGSFSAEHGIGRKNQALYDLYTSDHLRSAADHLKRALATGRSGALLLGFHD